MLDKLISIRETLTPAGTDVFAVVNSTMDTVQAVDLLLYVFDYDRAEALAGTSKLVCRLWLSVKSRKHAPTPTRTATHAPALN